MQKANATVLTVIALVAAGLVAAEWYFFDYRLRVAQAEMDGLAPDFTVPEASNLSGDTSQIIECEDSEGGKFYSNADSCEEAEPPETEATAPELPDE